MRARGAGRPALRRQRVCDRAVVLVCVCGGEMREMRETEGTRYAGQRPDYYCPLVAALRVGSLLASLDLVLDRDTDHGLAEVLRDLGKNLGVVVVGDGLDDGAGTLGGVAREDWACQT